MELNSGDFLRIQRIIIRQTIRIADGVVLRSESIFKGILYTRTRNFTGSLECKLNEVAEIERDREIRLDEVKCIRRLIVTNAPFPQFRRVNPENKEDGWLVCRWIWGVGVTNKYEGLIRRIQEAEADEQYKWKDSDLRDAWRGERIKEFEKDMEEARRKADEDLQRRRDEVKMAKNPVDLTDDNIIETQSTPLEVTAVVDLTQAHDKGKGKGICEVLDVDAGASRELPSTPPSTPPATPPSPSLDEGYGTNTSSAESGEDVDCLEVSSFVSL